MILPLTNLSSQRGTARRQPGPTPPRLVPAGETDDGPRQVPDFAALPKELPAFTVAGTAPEFRRLPFEPPPVRLKSVGGTLIDDAATSRADGLSNRR